MAAARAGSVPKTPAGLQVHVRRGLAHRDLVRRHDRLEVRAQPRQPKRVLDEFEGRRGGHAQLELHSQPGDRLPRSGDERQVLGVAIAERVDDPVVDLARGEPDAHLVAHVLRPLHGVGAHEGRLIVLAPVATVPGGELLADFVPLLLGLDEDPVEVEDDGIDSHDAGKLSRRPRRRAPGAGRKPAGGTTQPTRPPRRRRPIRLPPCLRTVRRAGRGQAGCPPPQRAVPARCAGCARWSCSSLPRLRWWTTPGRASCAPCPAEPPNCPNWVLTAPSSCHTSLERFSTVRMRKPICRLLRSCPQRGGPGDQHPEVPL